MAAKEKKKEKKEKKDRKGIFKEFKEFISRGNVFDMAVGIIVGGAFTAIVTALCDNVLKPIINWFLALIIGSDSLEGVYTFLKKATDTETGLIDLANSIYIDWGSLINAIINFLLIALVLFLIIKIINKIHQMGKAAKESVEESAKKRKESKQTDDEEAGAEDSASAEDSEKAASETFVEPVPETSAESAESVEESKE